MSNTPNNVSVIIPCYNGERFIGEAIESVLAQSFKNFEVIVVNDGSTDGSGSIVLEYLSDPRVRYIEHAENRGISAARNTGIKEATGTHIAFLDQDDLWRSDKLEKQMAVFTSAREGDVALVFSDRCIVFSDNPHRKRHFKETPSGLNTFSREKTIEAFYLRNFIPMVSILVRRECFDELGLLDENIRSGGDDYEFCTRLLRRYRVFHIPEPLVTRREHSANYTDDEKLMPDAIRINRGLVADYPNLARLQSRRESELLFKLGRALHAKGKRVEAKQAYRDAIRTRPSNVKSRVALALCHLGRLGDRMFDGWYRIRRMR
jgi:glycosyltransferase involved in cell wall biosynthesis